MITTERESTVYARWPLTFSYGSLADIQEVHVAAVSTDPGVRPAPEEMVTAQTVAADDPDLGRGTDDVAVLVGPPTGVKPAEVEHSVTDSGEDYQLWVGITTADEYILERAGTWEVV